MKMAKRTYETISSYLSYKYFSRINLERWKDEYKQKTGRETARGWNNSDEYRKYLNSQRSRVKLFAERNPEQFFKKKDTLLRHSKLADFEEYQFSDSPTPGSELLNPMKGSVDFGPVRILDAAENRAFILGKRLTTIFRLTAPGLFTGERIAASQAELMQIRSEMMKSYGQNIAKGKKKGDYSLIGADYEVDYYVTGNDMLAIVDIEMFLY